MSSSYRLRLNEWLSEQSVWGKVIDIGGSQESLKGRVKFYKPDELIVMDLENPHKDSRQPDVVLDLNETPDADVTPYFGFADQVFCLEVFDYVFDPVGAMYTIKHLLKPEGTAYVSFPFMYPQHQPIEDDALRYAPGGIQKLADRVGLKIVNMIPRHAETNAFEQYIRAERLRAAKHIPHNIIGWIAVMEKAK